METISPQKSIRLISKWLLTRSPKRFTGRLKFYNPENEFGFIIKTNTLEDIFFHLTDMEAVGITAKRLLEDKNLFFSFEELEYMGRVCV